MVTLTDAFRKLKQIKVLVLGDIVLDLYTMGSVERVSPEAPVPILLVKECSSLPGMAGNVALNLQAMGAETTLVGRVGDDGIGFDFLKLLKDRQFSTDGIVKQEGVRTPLKNRFIAHEQQLLRVDFEEFSPIPRGLEDEVMQYISRVISGHDVIALSDYGKGFLSDRLIAHVIEAAKESKIPVIVDPKGSDFTKYAGAFMIKPNSKEAIAASGLDENASLEDIAGSIFDKVKFKHLLITRSEKGMSILSQEETDYRRTDFPVENQNVNDVTGAGDTALAMIAFGIGNGLTLEHAIQLANIASGIAVGKLGCAAVKLSEVAKKFLDHNPDGKLFDDINNSFMLTQMISDNQLILLNLGEEDEISIKIFNLIRELHKEKDGSKLVIHILPNEKNRDFIKLLSSMFEVDFVVIQRISTEELALKLAPKKVVSLLHACALDSKPKIG